MGASLRLGLFTTVLLGACLLASSAYGQSALENPQLNSNQSGISAVTGWICNGDNPAVRFNGGAPLPVAYGTPRADTVPQCGDDNNGFSLLFNWNLLGAGTHLVELLNGGQVIASANVTIATFGVEFLPGVSGTLTGTIGGRQVTAVWSEAAQNLVITQVTGGPSGETGKWQVTREQGQFSDLPIVTLLLEADIPVEDFLGEARAPVLFITCQPKNSTLPELGNFIRVGVDHQQVVSAEAAYLRFDGGEIQFFLMDEGASSETLLFSVFQAADVFDNIRASTTLAYQFSGLDIGDVETSFDLRGLNAILDRELTISLNTEGGFSSYDCTPK